MTPEMEGFARHQLLNAGSQRARTDARLLFYDPKWNGFDIVIGNPPYEAIGKDQTDDQRKAIRDKLSGPKEYKTVGGETCTICSVNLR